MHHEHTQQGSGQQLQSGGSLSQSDVGPSGVPAGGQQLQGSTTGTWGGQVHPGGYEHTSVALHEELSPAAHAALDEISEAIRACEWCADRCVDEGPQMARCIRLCRDVADLARLSAAFVVRDSIFGPEVAQAFVSAAEECAMECQQHSHLHCQECAEVLDRAVRATRELLATAGGRGQQLPGPR